MCYGDAWFATWHSRLGTLGAHLMAEHQSHAFVHGYWWQRAYDEPTAKFILHPETTKIKDHCLHYTNNALKTLQQRFARLEARMREQSLLLERYDRTLTEALYKPGGKGFEAARDDYVARVPKLHAFGSVAPVGTTLQQPL